MCTYYVYISLINYVFGTSVLNSQELLSLLLLYTCELIKTEIYNEHFTSPGVIGASNFSFHFTTLNLTPCTYLPLSRQELTGLDYIKPLNYFRNRQAWPHSICRTFYY